MLDKVEAVIEQLIEDHPEILKGGRIQMFDVPDTVGDLKQVLFEEGKVMVLYCEAWGYIEVLGLQPEEFKILSDKYGLDVDSFIKDFLEKSIDLF